MRKLILGVLLFSGTLFAKEFKWTQVSWGFFACRGEHVSNVASIKLTYKDGSEEVSYKFIDTSPETLEVSDNNLSVTFKDSDCECIEEEKCEFIFLVKHLITPSKVGLENISFYDFRASAKMFLEKGKNKTSERKVTK